MAEISYTKTNWVNNVTKLNADNMNHIENGIEAATVEIDALKSDIDNIKKQFNLSNDFSTTLIMVLQGPHHSAPNLSNFIEYLVNYI